MAITHFKSKYSNADFAGLKMQFLADVVTTVKIPVELILNWGQTGTKIAPSHAWTINAQGSKRVKVV